MPRDSEFLVCSVKETHSVGAAKCPIPTGGGSSFGDLQDILLGWNLPSQVCVLNEELAKELKEALSVLMLCAPVFIFTSSSSFRAPTLWFMDLIFATCLIQITLF